MITLDASSMSEWQSCQRRHLLSQRYRPLRWRPKSLYDACLRQAVLSIVQSSVSPAAAASDARLAFLAAAASPGLDISTDPYRAAQEWCALLQTTLRGCVRAGLPSSLTSVPPIRLSSSIEWLPLSHSDGSSLHRWLAIDHWGEADLTRELHSWRTLGDIAATQLPMTIHVIEIGSVRSGRRASPWVRGWRHPTINSLAMRFKGKTKEAFKGWRPVYLTDSKTDPEAWVEQLWNEGAGQELLHDVHVSLPSDAQRGEVMRDILTEGIRIQKLKEERTSWSTLPMSRNACDVMLPCPFQAVCYREGIVEPESLGLYQIRRVD